MRALVADLLVVPVITAHPTEVRRQTVLDIIGEVARVLTARGDAPPGTPDRLEHDDHLRVLVLTLWQTAVLRMSKLRVTDEINEALRYYETSLFRVVPALERDLERLVADRWAVSVDATRVVRMGSWIGGDRDGNPFVTADVLRAATRRESLVALDHHLTELRRLARELSVSDRLVTPTAELLALAAASGDESPFRADEPYRRALRGMYARLFALTVELLGTDVTTELTVPPPAVRAPGLPVGGRAGGRSRQRGGVAALPRSRAARGRGRRSGAASRHHVRAAPVRPRHAPERGVHEVVVDELLRVAGVCTDYVELDEAARVAMLRAELASPRPLRSPFAAYSERTTGELDVLDAAADAVARLGAGAIPHYVISGAESPSDVLEAAVLLRECGLVRPGRRRRRDRHRAPVRDDRRPPSWRTRSSPRCSTIPRTRALVAGRGGRQEVMVGYSDSNKDGGYMAVHLGAVAGPVAPRRRRSARPAFGCASSTDAAAPSDAAAVRRTRRSSPSPPAPSTASCASPSRARWSRPSTASRRRPAATSRPWSPRRSRRRPARPRCPDADATRFETTMTTLSARAFDAYRSLVYDEPGFIEFFTAITPIREISTLNVGSRPASRTGSGRIQDLRAIPWVFGWTQCRLMLPGWYGSGSAFAALAAADAARRGPASSRCTSGGRSSAPSWQHGHGAGQGRRRRRRDTPTNSSPTRCCATGSSTGSSTEHDLTTAWHARITGSADPLAGNPTLARSIRNRYPYLDPLHVMQVELLRRYRAGDRDDLVERGIQLTLNAIATGLRNSG